jgi:hypothetical protein
MARSAAFRPGQSPPEVITPIFFKGFIMLDNVAQDQIAIC